MAEAKRFQAGISYGAFGSDITFGDVDGFIDRRAALATFEFPMSRKLRLQLGGGIGHGGRLTVDNITHEMWPGWLVTASASWLLLEEGDPPFVMATLSFGASGLRTQQAMVATTENYLAFDFRGGVVVGKTLIEPMRAYLAARVFGGPIFWRFRSENVIGTDLHHYQLGFGFAASLANGLNVFVEGAPFGERAASVGATVGF